MTEGVKMVDITGKEFTYREALAEGFIRLREETIKRIREKRVEKGDPLQVARIAAILAVKKTSELIPLCHPIKITGIDVIAEVEERRVKLKVSVRTVEQTGVEMEALVGVTAGLLAIWDVVKMYEKDERGQYPYTSIEGIRVISKVKGGAGNVQA